MFNTVNDFLAYWKYESEATLKVIKNLTDESLNQKVTQDGRTLGFITWHITTSISEMLSKTGLPVKDISESPVPKNVRTIYDEYEQSSSAVSDLISKQWNDGMLQDEVNMYGQNWKRAKVLGSLVTHQAHHRGQMTVLMRQAGLKVPGVYGPSKEEWAQFGMPTQE
jgi:uncharacterized damage-inducible protein DinB